MSLDIAESDWKKLCELHKVALERHCQKILSDVQEMSSVQPLSYHQLYLQLFKLIESSDKDIGQIFDNLKRSTALIHLVAYRTRALVTDQEFSSFSPETQDRVIFLIGSSRA